MFVISYGIWSFYNIKKTWVSAGAIAYHKGGTDPNNSKSNFSYYRLDAKGMYGMKDYAKIIYDICCHHNSTTHSLDLSVTDC